MGAVETPEPGREAAEAFVGRYLSHLVSDDVAGSKSFTGGQDAADAALASFDVSGYAARRNEVHPTTRRGASRLSPYIRHGLLSLREVWDHVASGPPRDVSKFRDELLWQEFARHWYARLGARTRVGIRRELQPPADRVAWNGERVRDMACLRLAIDELETDGWLVNQTRMWFASHWTVRSGMAWQDGEDYFFRNLLDGSRAANRLGWQWTSGVASNKAYGFSRSQVTRRAPEICDGCALRSKCPIEHWPSDPTFTDIDPPSLVKSGPSRQDTIGPTTAIRRVTVDHVWLTAESLGDADPALAAHPSLPIMFVFDEPLLARLQLSAKRLVFLTETLSRLARDRDVGVAVGRPEIELDGRAVAVTHAPVPGFRTKAAAIRPAETFPWPWLIPPHAQSIASFSAWQKHIELP